MPPLKVQPFSSVPAPPPPPQAVLGGSIPERQVLGFPTPENLILGNGAVPPSVAISAECANSDQFDSNNMARLDIATGEVINGANGEAVSKKLNVEA